jgi:hypothetical protein
MHLRRRAVEVGCYCCACLLAVGWEWQACCGCLLCLECICVRVRLCSLAYCSGSSWSGLGAVLGSMKLLPVRWGVLPQVCVSLRCCWSWLHTTCLRQCVQCVGAEGAPYPSKTRCCCGCRNRSDGVMASLGNLMMRRRSDGVMASAQLRVFYFETLHHLWKACERVGGWQ